jgi:GT2 family glycosyltransferase
VSEGPPLAVVLVSYRSREPLLHALDSLAAHAGLAHEVVVVDNASGDGTVEAVRERHPGALLLANDANVGFARACNQGWRACPAPLVLFLNPDAALTAGAVPSLARLLDERPSAGAAGPLLRSLDGAIEVSTGPDLSPLSEWRQRRLVRGVGRRDPRVLREAEALHSREREVDWVSGACLLVRREALAAAGGFDEGFFLYEEDADLCRRLRRAGWSVWFTPAAEVRHALGRSMAQAAGRARLEYHRSHLRYYRRHNGFLSRALLRALVGGRGAATWLGGILAADREARELGRGLVAAAAKGA